MLRELGNVKYQWQPYHFATLKDCTHNDETNVLMGTVIEGYTVNVLFQHRKETPWEQGERKEFPYIGWEHVYPRRGGGYMVIRSTCG